MSTLYVRNMESTTMAALGKEAKRKGISLAELVRQILNNHVAKVEVDNIDQKYRSFVSDVMALYTADREEVRRLSEKNEHLYNRMMDLIEGGERYE